ncbi:hypothetical protein HM1_1807 [Heliomicrobium modesticaldum Ice1]|uniref:Uncharacterized protein n=1 Tax=Heliobacterium modesticaldum (strain ATCC 51547 / Ice1) TaxID=498761 RepID=B0TEX0_HELMI|nr:hypothetical protein [Heliomicrobium modesticaldum]ABZ84372.1 hypothetical protein HM1_1807 [Heliomicrobium modesticaldum Ice1]
MKKCLSLITLGAVLLMAPAAFAADTTSTPPTSLAGEAEGINTPQNNAPKIKMTVEQRQAWKEALAPKLEQLKNLNEQMKDLHRQIKEQRESNQSLRQSLKGNLAKEQAQALRASVQSNGEAQKVLSADLKQLHDQVKVTKALLKAARQSGDVTAASAALDQLISLKQQILIKAPELLKAKQERYQILNGAQRQSPAPDTPAFADSTADDPAQ